MNRVARIILFVTSLFVGLSRPALAQCLTRWECLNQYDGFGTTASCQTCKRNCAGGQDGTCTGCWSGCFASGPYRSYPCPAQVPVTFEASAGGQTCEQVDGGSNFDCGPSRPCASGSSCMSRLNEDGTLNIGTKCVPNNCELVPTPGTSPTRYGYRCSGGEGPSGGGDRPPEPRGGNGGLVDGPGAGGKSPPDGERCQVGGPGGTGDPVSIADQRTLLNFIDVSLASSTDVFSLHRAYESIPTQWKAGNSLGLPDAGFVALPFGTQVVSGVREVFWWHSLFSFAFKPTFSSTWQVRLPGGDLVTFNPCTIAVGHSSCMASTTSDSMEARARLEAHSNGTFTYHAVSGRRYYYTAALTTAGSGGLNDTRYFLTEIRDRLGTRSLLTLTYATPPSTECTSVPGGNVATGVPYLRTATNAEGLTLTFNYVNRGPALPTGQQCVLRLVRIGQGAAVSNAIEYFYTNNDTTAGRISSTRNYLKPAQGSSFSTQSYVYPLVSPGSFRVHEGATSEAATASLSHEYFDQSTVKASYVGVGGSLQTLSEAAFPTPASAINCPAGTPASLCVPGSAFSTPFEVRNKTNGLGAGVPATRYVVATQVLIDSAPSRRTTGIASLTDAGTLLAAEGYVLAATSNGPFNQSIVRDRTDTTAVASAGLGPHIETTSITTGRGGEVEVTNYQYTYLDAGQLQGPLVQLLSREERNSVVPTQTTGKARTHFKYDTSGRQTALIQEGWTRTSAGAAPYLTWSDTQRFVGTFYLNPDSLGRPTRVEGPCLVAGTSANACTGTFPLTEFSYYSSSDANNKRLYQMKRYPTGSGLALTTTYSNYDVRGNAQTVTDENGVTTVFTFEADRPLTMTVTGAGTWSYAYDRGHLTRVTRPEGDSDVICHRRLGSTALALSAGCAASENPSDQPTAIFKYADGGSGGSWTEATIFTYGIDGEIREEAVYQAGNTTTPFRRTTRERNSLGFATFEKTGPAPLVNDAGVERTTRQFAADGLITAQSTPYFQAPDFCGTIGAPSELCTQFDYWATGRLKQMKVKPLAAATDVKVCLDYDAHGNVVGVRPDCTSTGMHSYVWDDFGNVIEAKLGTSSSPIRLEYDARGNITRKAILQWNPTSTILEWDYDQLSRPTQQRENGTIVLRWYYDNVGVPTPASGCMALASTTNQNGRLTLASDPVWHTWYTYDSQGRVTRESRISRTLDSSGSCVTMGLDTNQVIERTFTPNGNVATMTYPSGRQVVYSYDGAARVSTIGMKTWNGSWSSSPLAMVHNVAWFPGGVLKGYDVVSYETLGASPSTLSISYRYGANGSAPTAAIPTASCSWTPAEGADGSGDSSGRLRAIYVTRSGVDVMRIFYRWKGEHIAETSRCYLNAAVPLRENMDDSSSPEFQYDRAGRLGGANAPNYSSAGGYGSKRNYRYDTRGNRTKTEQYATTGYDFVYGASGMPDRMTKMVVNNGTTSDPILGYYTGGVVRSGRNRDYTYDESGRVSSIAGDFGGMLLYDYDSQSAPVAGSESVMRYAVLSNLSTASLFNYFYDAQNRRVRKQYPNGDLEGYFWGSEKELLMETAPTSIGRPERTMDEYLWLAGRPILSIRSTFDESESWARVSGVDDWAASCERRDEAGSCRPNAIITDVIGKPIATVDSSRRLAGVLEYDPYGVTNHTEHWGEIAPHQNTGCWWVVSWMQQGTGPLVREARAVLPRVDLPAYIPGVQGGCMGQYKSNPSQSPYGAPAGNDTCGPKQNYRFPWTQLADTDGLHVLYCSYSNDTTPVAKGLTVSGYDYRKYESGATHYTPPFRFPGQYFDPETEFHENWNRYYDPMTGRYLSPEPLLHRPKWVLAELRLGNQVPAYGYARNNPIVLTDPTGLVVPFCQRNPVECQRNADTLLYQECRCKRAGGSWTINFADRTPQDPLGELIIGGSCNIATNACGPNATGWSSNLMTDIDTWATSNPVLVCRQ